MCQVTMQFVVSSSAFPHTTADRSSTVVRRPKGDATRFVCDTSYAPFHVCVAPFCTLPHGAGDVERSQNGV